MALQDGKLFYKISEVASHLGVTASTLRFWEKEIPNLKPRTNKKGNRQYTQEAIQWQVQNKNCPSIKPK
jgi:DNA-binding transcriptional MerR regulator